MSLYKKAVKKFEEEKSIISSLIPIAQSQALKPQHHKFIFKDFPKLKFLGTGSMMPSIYRNVSSISLTFYDKYNILLDCGEGTLAQLTDNLGSSEAINNYLRNLRIIFITHIHTDHNIGMFSVIQERIDLANHTGEELEVISIS